MSQVSPHFTPREAEMMSGPEERLSWAPLLVEGAKLREAMKALAPFYPWVPWRDAWVLASAPFRGGCVFIFRALSHKHAFYSCAWFRLSASRVKCHVGAFYQPEDAVRDIERLTGERLGAPVALAS